VISRNTRHTIKRNAMYGKLPVSLIEIIKFRHSRSDIKSPTRADKNDNRDNCQQQDFYNISRRNSGASRGTRSPSRWGHLRTKSVSRSCVCARARAHAMSIPDNETATCAIAVPGASLSQITVHQDPHRSRSPLFKKLDHRFAMGSSNPLDFQPLRLWDVWTKTINSYFRLGDIWIVCLWCSMMRMVSELSCCRWSYEDTCVAVTLKNREKGNVKSFPSFANKCAEKSKEKKRRKKFARPGKTGFCPVITARAEKSCEGKEKWEKEKLTGRAGNRKERQKGKERCD